MFLILWGEQKKNQWSKDRDSRETTISGKDARERKKKKKQKTKKGAACMQLRLKKKDLFLFLKSSMTLLEIVGEGLRRLSRRSSLKKLGNSFQARSLRGWEAFRLRSSNVTLYICSSVRRFVEGKICRRFVFCFV